MTQPTPESRMSDAEPIRGRFVIQLSDDEHAALKAAAALIPVSMHDFVHAALTDFLGRAGTLAFSETAFHQGYLAATAHLSAEREELREVLQAFIYETTHLSAQEDDGSHRCKISVDTLRRARKLAGDKSDD